MREQYIAFWLGRYDVPRLFTYLKWNTKTLGFCFLVSLRERRRSLPDCPGQNAEYRRCTHSPTVVELGDKICHYAIDRSLN